MTPNITINNLSIEHNDRQLVKNFSLSIEGRSSVAIIGLSSCGKTSLLRTLAGLSEPKSGFVKLSGYSPNEAIQKRWIGFLHQEPVMWPHLSVEECIKLSHQIIHASLMNQGILQKHLELFDLLDHREKYPHALSTGAKARLAIARMAVMEPLFIFADEPFANIDQIQSDILNQHLNSMSAQYGSIYIWVTHDISDALEFADIILAFSGDTSGTIDVFDITSAAWKNGFFDKNQMPNDCIGLRDKLLGFIQSKAISYE